MESVEIEIWKDIPEYEGFYQVSNFGRVKSLLRTVDKINSKKQTMPEKIMALGFTGHYYVASLTKKDTPKRFYVHRLVALCFLTIDNLILQSLHVNHIDGIKLNNYYKNLEWCTPSENSIHAVKNRLTVMPNIQGINNGRSKLTAEEVIKIRNLSGTISQFEIAKKFGIKKAQVSTIINRKGWTHI